MEREREGKKRITQESSDEEEYKNINRTDKYHLEDKHLMYVYFSRVTFT